MPVFFKRDEKVNLWVWWPSLDRGERGRRTRGGNEGRRGEGRRGTLFTRQAL